MKPISAYIPCYNNAGLIKPTIASLQKQTIPIDEIFVIDDGSTDGSAQVAEDSGIRVIRHTSNLGRGAARHRAMLEARHGLVLCLDSAKQIAANFVESALPWFEDKRVGAVFAGMVQTPDSTVLNRWAARHLLKIDQPQEISRQASLITAAALVDKAVIMQVGNYNPALRYSEDRELGERLLKAGFQVVQDPCLQVLTNPSDNLLTVLERYWRWHAGVDNEVNITHYLKQIVFSAKVMSRQDLKAGDPLAIPISLFSPHYQMWRSCSQNLLSKLKN